MLSVTTPGDFSHLLAGDFNGDGKADLISTNSAGGQSVYLGNGDGTFRTGIPLPPSPNGTPFLDGSRSQLVGDFNGDGKDDFVDLTAGGAVEVFLSNGDGTFAPPSVGPVVGDNLFLRDFNRDGKLDLAAVVATPAPSVPPALGGGISNVTVTVLPGRGDGTFGAPITSVLSGFGLSSANSFAVADLNGDGNPDLVYESGVFLGNADGTFQPAIPLSSGAYNGTVIAATDLNGDGKADLVMTDSQGNVITLLGNGEGTFHYGSVLLASSGGWANSSVGFAVADFNNDGKPDLLITIDGKGGNPVSDGSARVYTGNGGSFGPTFVPVPFAHTYGRYVIADFDGDKVPDYATTLDAGQLSVTLRLQTTLNTMTLPSSQTTLQFGMVGGRHLTSAVQHLADGTTVTYTLTGPGTGTVTPGLFGTNFNVSVDGASPSTSIRIARSGTPASQTQRFALDSIIVHGSMHVLDTRGVSVASVTVFGDADSVLEGDAGPLTITGRARQIRLGKLAGALVVGGSIGLLTATDASGSISSGAITSMDVKSWDGTITATSIQSLVCRGDFMGALNLSGAGSSTTALGSARIAGNLSPLPGTNAQGGSGFPDWAINGNIGTIVIGKNVSNVRIDAGANQPDYTAAKIGVIHVHGSVTSSIFAAGLQGQNNQLLLTNVGVLLRGGAMDRLLIGGQASTDSRFLAASLPKKVKIGGTVVTSAADQRFTPRAAGSI
jgi:hypothetical protein